jgi:hypothetical protein
MTELIDKPEASEAPTPQEVGEQRAKESGEAFLAKLKERTEALLLERGNGANRGIAPRIGEPTVGPYVAFDVIMTSPWQFTGPPPYQPSKVIAAGESAYIFAYTWVNPTVDIPDGFAVPAAVQLNGRTWRLTLDLLNVTTGQTQSLPQTGLVQPGASVQPGVGFAYFLLPTPDPGSDPAVMEANVTLDIVDPGQPYAAFATNFFDYDADPGYVFVPPAVPGWRHEQPNRYIVYSK